MVTHWMAISGDSPPRSPAAHCGLSRRSSACRWRRDRRWQRRSATSRQDRAPADPLMISGMVCDADLDEEAAAAACPRPLPASHASWSEASPAAAKALIDGRSRSPAPWPSTTPRASMVAPIMPHNRSCEGLSGFHTAGQSITSSSPATMALAARNAACSAWPIMAAAPFIGGRAAPPSPAAGKSSAASRGCAPSARIRDCAGH